MPANVLLSNALWSFSATGGSGTSLVVMSVLTSAPGGDSERQGRYTVFITNNNSTAPLHVQANAVFTNIQGTSTVVPHTLFLVSNAQTFGGSAAQIQGLVLLLSGQGAAIPLEVLGGSALQIVLLAASNTTSTQAISGAVAVWRV